MQLCLASTELLLLVLVLVLCLFPPLCCCVALWLANRSPQNELVFRFKQNASMNAQTYKVNFCLIFERLFQHFAVFRDSRRYFFSACGPPVWAKPNPPFPPTTLLTNSAVSQAERWRGRMITWCHREVIGCQVEVVFSGRAPLWAPGPQDDWPSVILSSSPSSSLSEGINTGDRRPLFCSGPPCRCCWWRSRWRIQTLWLMSVCLWQLQASDGFRSL